MRRLFILVFGVVLLTVPRALCAAPASPPVPPFDSPFDDTDPAINQAEVTRQVASFLQALDAQWGTTQEAIRARVSGTLEREDHGALIYTRTIADHGVLEGYDFRDGSLMRGQYVFLQRPVNALNEFIDYYAAVKECLVALYGPPAEDRTIWENDLYQPLPDYWGIAVQIGHLRYAATWETAEGTLTMELTGNHHSRLTIDYRSKIFLENQQTA